MLHGLRRSPARLLTPSHGQSVFQMSQSQREARSKHPAAHITSRQHALVKTFRAVARGDESRALLDGWHLLHEAAAMA